MLTVFVYSLSGLSLHLVSFDYDSDIAASESPPLSKCTVTWSNTAKAALSVSLCPGRNPGWGTDTDPGVSRGAHVPEGRFRGVHARNSPSLVGADRRSRGCCGGLVSASCRPAVQPGHGRARPGSIPSDAHGVDGGTLRPRGLVLRAQLAAPGVPLLRGRRGDSHSDRPAAPLAPQRRGTARPGLRLRAARRGCRRGERLGRVAARSAGRPRAVRPLSRAGAHLAGRARHG